MDLALAELAASYGISTEYFDWQGQHVEVPESTVRAVLKALDVDDSSPAAALSARRAAAENPDCLVVRQGAPLPPGTVRLEDGGELPSEADLPLGYHSIVVDGRSIPLIVTPDRLPAPEPGWGLAAQVYSVRSRGSWGIGDLGDLRLLGEWAAVHGADFVLVNPMHAAAPTTPMEPSPYLPVTRLFANPIYLRLEEVPEWDGSLDTLRATADTGSDLIDRDAAWTAKRAALHHLHAQPRRRAAEYRAYLDRKGDSLRGFATWCALADVHGPDWHAWPADLQDPQSPAVADFVAANETAVDFHAWLQFLLDEQFAAVQQRATDAGMRLGVMHDLAVGVDPDGSEAWLGQDLFARGVSVGAPPDAYSQAGQAWSQPPWRPDRLAATGYRPFRELVANILEHAGGVRIDHIIGLFRLWWIPPGQPPTAGTYVRYDHEALVGILALEAVRNGAVIVGEDLGTVEPSAREYLKDRGILGTSILWFECDWDADGEPLPPERWRELCLASVTTHDLPPTAGYLDGAHLRLRHELGMLTEPLDSELANAARQLDRWRAELQRLGLLGPHAGVDETVDALHRFLGRTPSLLRCLSLVDAVGDRRAQNQPGTSDEYPNWRVPLAGPDGVPVFLEDALHSERAVRLAELMRVTTPGS